MKIFRVICSFSVILIFLSSIALASATRVQEADSLISSDHSKNWSFPSASDTFAGLSATQSFSNKEFASPLLMDQSSTPSNPSASKNKLYFKSDNNLYMLNSSGTENQVNSSAVSVTSVTISDQKSSGTDGGTGTASAWTQRVLNTLNNPSSVSWVSLASNQFTLNSGTYLINVSSPFDATQRSVIKLYNVTDSVDAIYGSGEYAGNGGSISSVRSNLVGVFVISSTKTYEIDYYIQSSTGTSDLGVSQGHGNNEVYTLVTLQKLQ